MFRRSSWVIASVVVVMADAAVAAPGDIHTVTNADLVNLRAGPSDETNVRGRVEQGDEVIELTREGNWVGVRVLRTGEEGWIYGGLLETKVRSGLDPSVQGGDAGFSTLSDNFDRLIRGINGKLGFPIVESVEQVSANALRITPTSEWLLNGSREAHMMAVAAIYEMWRNHQNSAPVAVTMLDAFGEDYVSITDESTGPSMSVRP
jgi:hypothetical protein